MTIANPGGNGNGKLSNKELGRRRGRWLDQVNDDPKMTPSYRAVCYQIAKRMMANNGGRARSSNSQLAVRAGCCLRIVNYAVQTAVDRGHLRIESRCRGDRVFVVIVKSSAPIALASAPIALASARPIREVAAAEGLLNSHSLSPSLNPYEEGKDSKFGEQRKGLSEEGRKVSEHIVRLRARYAAGEFPTRR